MEPKRSPRDSVKTIRLPKDLSEAVCRIATRESEARSTVIRRLVRRALLAEGELAQSLPPSQPSQPVIEETCSEPARDIPRMYPQEWRHK